MSPIGTSRMRPLRPLRLIPIGPLNLDAEDHQSRRGIPDLPDLQFPSLAPEFTQRQEASELMPMCWSIDRHP